MLTRNDENHYHHFQRMTNFRRVCIPLTLYGSPNPHKVHHSQELVLTTEKAGMIVISPPLQGIEEKNKVFPMFYLLREFFRKFGIFIFNIRRERIYPVFFDYQLRGNNSERF